MQLGARRGMACFHVFFGIILMGLLNVGLLCGHLQIMHDDSGHLMNGLMRDLHGKLFISARW